MEKLLIIGHKNPDTDSICSSIVLAEIQSKMTGEEVEAVRLGNINQETEYALKYFEVEPQRMIEKVEEGQPVMLVDHNEFTQSVEGIEKAKILGVIDHHKIANFQTSEPLFYMAQPVGCTATIIYDICLMNNIEISKKMAGLLLSAIISDTLLLKSPTCTVKDIEIANKLEKIAEVDKNTYGLEMLKAGTKLDGYTEEELLNLDSKKFEKDNVKYMIAQVNTVSIEDVLKKQDKIEEAMRKVIEENQLNLCLLAITDIVNSNSEAIVIGNRTDIIEKTYKIENNRTFMPGVVSRKKQIIPLIEANI
ncbi:MAG: manganese-dependent inorganic pyrophosphatase [Clostridia bacterium]|jgi:manganese-dependent inorganic pyrophosphatase|nr:manganese-dependent inorganic pyrophosphatase [Clostridia bacterium]